MCVYVCVQNRVCCVDGCEVCTYTPLPCPQDNPCGVQIDVVTTVGTLPYKALPAWYSREGGVCVCVD